MRQKGIDLNHDFYFVVGKQCRTIFLNKLINVFSLFICFKLVSHTKNIFMKMRIDYKLCSIAVNSQRLSCSQKLVRNIRIIAYWYTK